MSMAQVAEIDLLPTDIFDHTKVLKTEIARFEDNFIKNERYKEFDGLIRRNHRIYEAVECNLKPVLQSSTCYDFCHKLDRITKRLDQVSKFSVKKEHLTNVQVVNLTAVDIARLAEAIIKAPTLDHMDPIQEDRESRSTGDEFDEVRISE